MGLGPSLPKEKDTPAMLNFILQEMFRRADLADIYSLADPERCKRYIIVGEKALMELFLKIDLYPETGKDGSLYFQSLDGFKGSLPAPLREQQTAYCKQLSFFFIRIFQTFGALYLSIYDSRIPLSDPVEEKRPVGYTRGTFQNPADFMGYDLKQKPRQSFWGGSQTGGDLRQNSTFYIPRESPYGILNDFLVAPKDSDDQTTSMKFEHNPLFIIQKTLYDFNGRNRTFKNSETVNPLVTYYFDRNTKTNIELSAVLTIKKSPSDVYMVALSNFQGGENWPTGVKMIQKEFIEQLKFSPRYSEIRSSTNKTLPQVLKNGFDEAILKMLGAPPLSVVGFLKKYSYVSSSSYENQNIRGTHAYILKDQESQDSVNIVYSSSISIEREEGKKSDRGIKISAKLKIARVEERSEFVTDVLEKYRVILNFTNSRVEPSELSSMIDIPDEKYNIFISEGGRAPKSDNQRELTIPDYIENVFKAIIGHSDTTQGDSKGLQRTREGLIKPYNSDRIDPEFKVKKLWSAMAQDPPVKSHCIARAVQLLSVNAIRGNFSEPAFTSVCNLSFRYQKDGSLPTPGKDITTESGIYALTLLFFDSLYKGNPKIFDKTSYTDYLKTLKYLFESRSEIDNVKNEFNNIPSSISKIKSTTFGICDNKKKDGPLALPQQTNLAGKLKTITDDLIQQQKNHFVQAMILIFRLFDQNSIEQERKLKFNRAIIRGGMKEIENIANSTRELLLN